MGHNSSACCGGASSRTHRRQAATHRMVVSAVGTSMPRHSTTPLPHVSSPTKSAKASGPMGAFVPSFIPVSMSCAVPTPCE